MEHVHLCLSDLLDQDISANEFYQTLPNEIKAALQDRDITTFAELQEYAKKLKGNPLYG
ncbi:MAG: hypothetical protein VB100_00635 [Angelakisella sp.]|nr:hypothetical protein [Angelakisella sp.]